MRGLLGHALASCVLGMHTLHNDQSYSSAWPAMVRACCLHDDTAGRRPAVVQHQLSTRTHGVWCKSKLRATRLSKKRRCAPTHSPLQCFFSSSYCAPPCLPCSCTCPTCSRPAIPQELKQLLSDPQAAAAADASAKFGACEVLSPVRPRKQVQQALGAAEQVSQMQKHGGGRPARQRGTLAEKRHSGRFPAPCVACVCVESCDRCWLVEAVHSSCRSCQVAIVTTLASLHACWSFFSWGKSPREGLHAPSQIHGKGCTAEMLQSPRARVVCCRQGSSATW